MTLEDDDAVLLCLMTWSFDGGLDDVLVDGGFGTLLLYILPVS